MKTYKDFEDFLVEKHAEQYEGLDDDMPEDFDRWLADKDVPEWIALGDRYARAILKRPDYLKRVSEAHPFIDLTGGKI